MSLSTLPSPFPLRPLRPGGIVPGTAKFQKEQARNGGEPRDLDYWGTPGWCFTVRKGAC
jgi:hypothetical protein